jgi:hypothetical protein
MNNKIAEHVNSTPFSLMFGRESNNFIDYSNVEINPEIYNYQQNAIKLEKETLLLTKK